MWVLKLEIYNEEARLNQLAHMYDVTMRGFPLSSYEKHGRFFLIGGGTLSGEEQAVEQFLQDIKQDKTFTHVEYNSGFFLVTLEQPAYTLPFYSSELIHLEPICIDTNFTQTYLFGSWNKKLLDTLALTKFPNGKLTVKKFREEKIKGITITALDAKLTDKQRHAFDLAYKKGYYEVPRTTDLAELAKESKLSLSTFQAHLRKAERAITGFFSNFR